MGIHVNTIRQYKRSMKHKCAKVMEPNESETVVLCPLLYNSFSSLNRMRQRK